MSLRGQRKLADAPREFLVKQRIDGIFGVGSKSERMTSKFPRDTLAARVLLTFENEPEAELGRITTFELWPGGDVSGEREVKKPFSVTCTKEGRYSVRFEGEYGLFVVLNAYLGWGCGIGISVDSDVVVEDLWKPEAPSKGIKVREEYLFEKEKIARSIKR